MLTHLPPWYVDALRQEILRLREMLEPLEKGNGSLGGKTGTAASRRNILSAIKKQLLTCSLFWTITTLAAIKASALRQRQKKITVTVHSIRPAKPWQRRRAVWRYMLNCHSYPCTVTVILVVVSVLVDRAEARDDCDNGEDRLHPSCQSCGVHVRGSNLTSSTSTLAPISAPRDLCGRHLTRHFIAELYQSNSITFVQ